MTTPSEPSVAVATTGEHSIEMAATDEASVTVTTTSEPSVAMADNNEPSVVKATTSEHSIEMAAADEPPATVTTTKEISVTMAMTKETSVTMEDNDEPAVAMATPNRPSTSANSMSISSDETANNVTRRKTVHDFNVFLSTFTSDEGTPFTNGYAMLTWKTLGKDNGKTAKKLLAVVKERGMQCSKSGLVYRLKLLQRTVFVSQKNIHVEWSRLTSMMNEMFRLPKTRTKPQRVDDIDVSSANCNLQ